MIIIRTVQAAFIALIIATVVFAATHPSTTRCEGAYCQTANGWALR
jgi:hypothetical protein